jgi:hypothetical protein
VWWRSLTAKSRVSSRAVSNRTARTLTPTPSSHRPDGGSSADWAQLEQSCPDRRVTRAGSLRGPMARRRSSNRFQPRRVRALWPPTSSPSAAAASGAERRFRCKRSRPLRASVRRLPQRFDREAPTLGRNLNPAHREEWGPVGSGWGPKHPVPACAIRSCQVRKAFGFAGTGRVVRQAVDASGFLDAEDG